MDMLQVAIIGAGSISDIYLSNLSKRFKGVKIAGICDLIPERARNAQAKYHLQRVYQDMYDAFRDPAVDIILNLTRPYQHFEVSRLALEHGKHLYTEKPLGISIEEGNALVSLAQQKGLRIGGAPDTFLGAGLQSCRHYLDSGMIGQPLGAAAFMLSHGPETWHPDPDFYYQEGGGPMMDMGPYYITALVSLLGPVKRLVAASKKSFAKRKITSQPHWGEDITVNTDTHVAGTMLFENGVLGTIFTTFDVYSPSQARLEIYGIKGTLYLPDPNYFEGPIKVLRPEDGQVRELPLLLDYSDNSRGLGLADMAAAILSGRDARANQGLVHHVLEVLTGFERSVQLDQWLDLITTCSRPLAMEKAVLDGVLD